MRLASIVRLSGIAALGLAMAPAAMAADPFLSAPGVAQRAQAGAGVAGPGSLASVWHNPATLVDAQTEVTFEWQEGPDHADDGALAKDNAWLAGATYVNRDKWYGTAATGIAAYTPHKHKLAVAQSGEANSAFGRSDVTTQVVGVPYALEFEEQGLALGAVGEIVTVDPKNSDLRVETTAGTVEEAELPSGRRTGFSGAFGLRYRLHRDSDNRVDLAAVLRTRATAGASLEVDSNTAEYLLPDKPGGYDLGARWRRALDDDRELAAQVQLATTDWGRSGTMRRRGIGVSLRSGFGEWGPFRGGERIWRAGYSRFRPDEAQSWMDWPEGSAWTGGLSLAFGNGTRLDFSLERRTEQRDAFDDDQIWFAGAAISFAY